VNKIAANRIARIHNDAQVYQPWEGDLRHIRAGDRESRGGYWRGQTRPDCVLEGHFGAASMAGICRDHAESAPHRGDRLNGATFVMLASSVTRGR
jgi:hypothetical protein